MAKKIADKTISTVQTAIQPTNARMVHTRQIITDILDELSRQYDLFEAMDVIVDRTPDGRMALNTYITFTNRGGEFIFRNPKTGERTKKPDVAFDKFRKKIDLYKLGDQWARSAYTHTGMAYEIVVSKDLNEITDVLVVDPATFKEFRMNPNTNKWQIFQYRNDTKEIDLYSGNFKYFPYQPKPSSPVGTVAFGSALSVLILYYQFMLDATTITNRIALPRYDVMLNMTAFLERLTQSEKTDSKELSKLVLDEVEKVKQSLYELSRDSDFVHTDTTTIDIIGGGVNGSGIDIRAWTEMFDPLICNAFNLKPIMMGREQGGSYAKGTAEYEAFISGIDPVAEDLVKIYEDIANMFCRIYGYNAICEFKLAPLEWQDEKIKWEIKNLQADFYSKCEESGWNNGDIASQELFGLDKKPNRDNDDRFRWKTSADVQQNTTVESEKDNEIEVDEKSQSSEK